MYTQHTCEAILTKYEHHLQTKSDRRDHYY